MNKNTPKKISKKQDVAYQIKVPNTGVGRMVTTTTTICILLASLEEGSLSRLWVLDDVLKEMGIEPEDIIINRENAKADPAGVYREKRKPFTQEYSL